MNTDKNEKIKQLKEVLGSKCLILSSLEQEFYKYTDKKPEPVGFWYWAENNLQFAKKKQDKYMKHIEKAEQELQELRDLIIKQNELKKVSPAGFENVFEQTKIQMNIRKTDLKKKIKDLKNKIEYCNTQSQRNIECLEITNECLRKEMKELMLSKEETEKEIMQLERRLKEMEEAQYKRICTEEKEGVNV